MNVSLADTQISIRGAERVEEGGGEGRKTAAALGQDKEKQCETDKGNSAFVPKVKA